MDNFARWYDQDLAKPILLQYDRSLVFSGDNESVTVGVHVANNGEAASLAGTVSGAVIRSNGTTVPLTGTLSGSDVSVVLTSACFNVPGPIGVSLTVTSGDQKITVLKVVYSVEPTSTDTVVDPVGEVALDVADLIDDIENAVASIPADYNDLLAAVAPTFSTSTAYAAGAYVWYDGALYRFITAHPAGSWTGSDATFVSIGADLEAHAAAIAANAADIDAAEAAITQTRAMIAPTETNPAASAHAVGENIIYNGTLYEVIAPIAANDALTVGTNIAAVANGVSGQVSELMGAVNVIQYRPGENLYDEAHNGQIQSNPQYTVGTVYLNGYTGDIVVSCKATRANYITDPYVYDENGQTLAASFDSNIVYPAGIGSQKPRSGKLITIPSGAVRFEFKYRTASSTSTLVEEVMVTTGATCPRLYEQYQNIPYLVGSDYLVPTDLDKIAYVSTDGNDANDGLTYETAVASLSKGLNISNVIAVKRGTYAENLIVSNRRNVKIIPYDNNASFDIDEPVRDKIVVNASTFTVCDGLHIEDVKFNGGVLIDQSMGVELYNCDAVNGASHGFQINNSNIVMNRCYAAENTNDGFNFQSYGQSIMNDCVSYHNGDDGCSHHYGCMGTIYGGQFVDNQGKGGVTPAYGAVVNIIGAYCARNPYGIYYLSSSNVDQIPRTCVIDGCAMEGNTTQGLCVTTKYTVIAINCAYKNNTSDKLVTGTLNEMMPSDPNKITAPVSPATGAILTYNGSAWVAEAPQT